ncbi:MAG: MFS transporter [Pirellulaceae bacterium]|nr:MFS transporter [Pirellulaceae bacterium]
MLPTIVLGQVCVTSTWFAPNAIMGELTQLWQSQASIGAVTTAVQLGFIAGTLLFGVTGLADRVSLRWLFLFCAWSAAGSNAGLLWAPENVSLVLVCRLLTGFSLAGVYPVGMKLAASWYVGGLGRALGYLVGALVLGTASPHLMQALNLVEHWQFVIWSSTVAALVGGLVVATVTTGPHVRSSGPVRVVDLYRSLWQPEFRACVVGYFGHMWELYAFWAWMPLWIATLKFDARSSSLLAFAVIASGAISCALGGLAAVRWGSRTVAVMNLRLSAICCLISPLVYMWGGWWLIGLLIVWGLVVVGDSPQLSALNAASAPRELVGSALTLTTCLGFSITVASIFLLDALRSQIDPAFLFWPLAIGPVVGAWSLRR